MMDTTISLNEFMVQVQGLGLELRSVWPREYPNDFCQNVHLFGSRCLVYLFIESIDHTKFVLQTALTIW